jgi:broad specificity phosphatase PhoE
MKRLLALALGGVALAAAAPSVADEAAWRALAEPGAVLMVRHAQTVPGIGDPPGYRLDDCATQRNLSEDGRRQAAAMGSALAARGVKVARVESSRWCRCVDTARLAFPGQAVHMLEALNSFFDDRAAEPARTRALRARIAAWRGPGVLVLVTHQVNITALTGRTVAMGEGVVLRGGVAAPAVVGAIAF